MRKQFKTWGVMFVCLGSRAVSLWLSPSYSCRDFLLCLQRQVAVYGKPRKLYSDQGSQLVAAAGEVREWHSFREEAEKEGIVWEFSPVACAWRNGQAERAIGLAKAALKQQVDSHELLDFCELETALLRVAEVINRRPLTARLYDDNEFYPVCPANLLLGRVHGYRGTRSEGDLTSSLSQRLEKVSRVVELWWERWQAAAFSLFTPRYKWKQEVRPLAVGDVVLLLSSGKLGPGTYRLAMVDRLFPDESGVVRTVEIAFTSRRKRGRAVREVSRMAVQRLAVILPAEERWSAGMQEN